MNVHSENLVVKRPWLKYIEEENKMHCVTCREAVEVDKSIKGENVYITGTDKFKSDCSNIMSFQQSAECYENSYW